MKINPWLLLLTASAGLLVLATLPNPKPVAQSEGMKTLSRAKKPARTLRKTPSSKPRLTPLPAAKSSGKELAAKVRAGKFAVGVDIAKVIEVVESRSSRRL